MNTKRDEYRALIASDQAALLIVDHQPGLSPQFGPRTRSQVVDGLLSLAQAAKSLSVPIVITMIEADGVQAKPWPDLAEIAKGAHVIRRQHVNPWEHAAFAEAVRDLGRSRLLVAGLCAEVTLTFTVLCALEVGFDTYVVKDTVLGRSRQTIETVFERMTQAGAVPVTWRQVIFEWHRGSQDYETLDPLMNPRF